MKKCFKCNEVKPLDQFYAHPQMKDGRVNKCKECNKKDVHDNYRANITKYIQYEKERFAKPERKEQAVAYQKKRRELAKHKTIANYLTTNAIRDKRLNKQPCAVCGEVKVEAHHRDYYKPLEVVWLCRVHHLEEHGKVAYSISAA